MSRTVLAQQQGIEALQVKNLNDEWISAPPIEGTFVCNLGDRKFASPSVASSLTSILATA